METKEITYECEGVTLKGYLANDESVAGPKPGVLVAHAWGGRDEFACEKAREMAALGYVGFALDMYGDAKLGTNNDENAALMTPFMENRTQVAARMGAALTTLKSHEAVDGARTAAIGYCFGGLCVLDLARSGAEVSGVVSFHGLLQSPEGQTNESVKAKVLALHGYSDPMAPPEAVTTFASEMTEREADWHMTMYGQTLHAFTNPQANDKSFGTVYSETASNRSWQAMKSFFEEIF